MYRTMKKHLNHVSVLMYASPTTVYDIHFFLVVISF